MEKNKYPDMIAGIPRKEYMAQWRLNNKELKKAMDRDYYLRNKEKIRAYMKEYHKKNPRGKPGDRIKEWIAKNPHIDIAAVNRNHGNRQRKELRNNYLKGLIRKATGLKFNEITEELIGLKREQLLMYREIESIKGLLSGAA